MATRRRILALASAGICAAVAGCSDGEGDDPGTPPETEEVRVTVRLRNRDDADREYETVIRQGNDRRESSYRMDGVLAPDTDQYVEMVATFRPEEGDRHEVTISSTEGQRGHTWDPFECGDYLVEAYVEEGEPYLDGECRES